MLRTKHNEVLAALTDLTLLISDHTCFAASFIVKKSENVIKKKRGYGQFNIYIFRKRLGRVWLSVTNTTVLQTGDSKSSVVAVWGYICTGNCRGADHTKLFAAARLPPISKPAHF